MLFLHPSTLRRQNSRYCGSSAAIPIPNNCRFWQWFTAGVILLYCVANVPADEDAQDLPATQEHFLKEESNSELTSIPSRPAAGPVAGEIEFRGRVSRFTTDGESRDGLDELKIYLVRNSLVVTETTSDADGVFTLGDLQPGTYALCAISERGFLAFGIRVRTDGVVQRPGPSGQWVSLPSATLQETTYDIDAAAVPPTFNSLNRITSRYLPSFSDPADSEAVDSESLRGLDQRSVAQDISVRLQPDGSLVGRMAPLARRRDKPSRLREMNAFLIEDDEIYARVTVNADGSFKFRSVDPGNYSFIAAGEEGFAAIGFRALLPGDEDSTVNRSREALGQVSLASTRRHLIAGSLSVPLSAASESTFMLEQLQLLAATAAANSSGNSTASTPSSQASGPSSGGGGGEGGLEGVGTAAFFAAVLAGTFSDDDDPLAGSFPGNGSFPGTGTPGNGDNGNGGGDNGNGGGDDPSSAPGDNPPIPEPATVIVWILIAVVGASYWGIRQRLRHNSDLRKNTEPGGITLG
ncbi:MAG: hypothetical protein VYE53_11285 [Planctomycetota bacterium]|nr:hypothetical protein [Planctomycetota bacterium]